MDVDETKRRCGCLQDRVCAVCAHAIIGLKHSRHQVGEVLRPRTDEFGQWIIIVVALAEKDAVGPQPNMHKPAILDQDVLQPDDFIEGEFVFSGLQYSFAPALQPVAGRPLSLDFKTSAAVGQ